MRGRIVLEEHHESRRFSRDTYPQSHATTNTSIRRYNVERGSLFARKRANPALPLQAVLRKVIAARFFQDRQNVG